MTLNKKYRSLILSVIFTFLILFLLFKSVSLNEVIRAIKSIPLKFVIFGFLFHLSAYFFRTLVLFSFLKEQKIKFLYLLCIHFIHNFCVQIIPASLGEFSFPILLKNKLNMAKSFSILVISRLLSLIMFLLLFLISGIYLFDFLNIIDLKSNFMTWSFLLLLIIGLGLIIIFAIIRHKTRLLKIIRNIKRFSKVYNKIKKVYEITRVEIIKLKKFKFSSKILAFTIFSVFGTTCYFLIILKGINVELNILQVIFVSSIGAAFLILPIKSIGGFGTTEASWAIGLMLLGLTKETAIQAGFVVHIFALLNVTILFIVGLIFNFVNNKKDIIFYMNKEGKSEN